MNAGTTGNKSDSVFQPTVSQKLLENPALSYFGCENCFVHSKSNLITAHVNNCNCSNVENSSSKHFYSCIVKNGKSCMYVGHNLCPQGLSQENSQKLCENIDRLPTNCGNYFKLPCQDNGMVQQERNQLYRQCQLDQQPDNCSEETARQFSDTKPACVHKALSGSAGFECQIQPPDTQGVCKGISAQTNCKVCIHSSGHSSHNQASVSSQMSNLIKDDSTADIPSHVCTQKVSVHNKPNVIKPRQENNFQINNKRALSRHSNCKVTCKHNTKTVTQGPNKVTKADLIKGDQNRVTLSRNNTLNCKLPDKGCLLALIDSGCSHSIISRQTIMHSRYLSSLTPQRISPVKITIADGNSLRINELLNFEITIGDIQIPMSAYIVETIGLFNLLIGVNTLTEMEGVLDIKARCLKFRKPKNKNFKTMYATTLEPYQTKNVRIFGKMPTHLKNAECMLKTTKFSSKFSPNLSLHKLTKGQTTLVMRNPSNKRIKLHKNACVATLDMSCNLANYDRIDHCEKRSQHTILFAQELLTDSSQQSEFDMFEDVHLLNPKDMVTLRDLTVSDTIEQYCYSAFVRQQDKQTDIHTMLSNCADCRSRIQNGKSLPACKHHAYKEGKQDRHELAKRKRKLYPFLDSDDPKLFLYDEEILFKEIPLNSDTTCLPLELRELLRGILMTNKEAFSLHGETGNADHTVKLRIKEGAKPKYIRPYVASEEDKKVIDKEIRKLELMNIITPGAAQHVSPLLLVDKKEANAKRVCVDLRYANKQILPNPWPYPLIRDTLKRIGLSGAKFFSSFDVKNAFHSLKLHPDSQEWAGLSTYYGGKQYKIVRLPQGCSSSSSEWTRYIEGLLDKDPELREHIDIYIDDLVLYNQDWETHMKCIEKVLNLFKTHGLKLSPGKTKLFVKTITYLGHVITIKDGKPHVAAMRSKCDAIRRIKTPSSARELRAFIGMSNYLSMYLPKLQIHLQPLYELTKKNVKFKWEPRHEEAFQTVKKMFESPQILSLPQEKGEYRLYSDTSRTGCGGCLTQVQDGEEKVIAFHSKSLPAAAKNYSVTCLELTGVYLNILAFSHVLKGRNFKVIVDHSALVHMMHSTKEPPNLRLRKLYEKLSNYSFQVSYLKGKNLVCADLLSRYTIPSQEPDYNIVPIACPVTDDLVDVPSTTGYNDLEESDFMEIMTACLSDIPPDVTSDTDTLSVCDNNSSNISDTDSESCYPVTRSSSKPKILTSKPKTTTNRPMTRSFLKDLKQKLPSPLISTPLRSKGKSDTGTPSTNKGPKTSVSPKPANSTTKSKAVANKTDAIRKDTVKTSQILHSEGDKYMKNGENISKLPAKTGNTGLKDTPPDAATIKARKKELQKMSTKKLTKLLTNHLEQQRLLAQQQNEHQEKLLNEVRSSKNQVQISTAPVHPTAPPANNYVPTYTPINSRYPLRSSTLINTTTKNHNIGLNEGNLIGSIPQLNKTKPTAVSPGTPPAGSDNKKPGTQLADDGSESKTQENPVHSDPFQDTDWSKGQESLLAEQIKRAEGNDNAHVPFSSLVPRHTNLPQPELIDEFHSSPPEELYYKPEPLFGKLSNNDIICKKVPRQQDLNKIIKEIKTRCLRDFSIPLKTAEIKREQEKDPFFKDIYAYLSSGILPTVKRKARSILAQSEQYIFVQNVLFKCDFDKKSQEMKLTLCIPESQAQYIISLYHESLLGSHQGVHRCYLSIRRHYYIHKLYDKLYQFLRSCIICQRRKSPTQPQTDVEYEPRIFLKYRPFSEIHMDLKKMYPSSQGHEHLLVINCVMTRYTICVPLHKADVVSVIEALMQNVIFTFGPPKRIVMDLATYNTAKMLNYIMKCFNIDPVYISKYNHQSLTSERQIKSLSDILLSQLEGYGKNWHLYVKAVAYSYNTFCHSYMGFSPFEMALGREPPEVLNIKHLPDENLPVSHKEYVDALKDRLQSIGRTVLNLQTEHQEKQLQEKRAKCKPGNTFSEGQLVMLLMPEASDLHTNSKSFKIQWIGPLKIKEQLDPTHYILCDLQDRLIWGIHHRKRLKSAFIKVENKNVSSINELKNAVSQEEAKGADVTSAHCIQIVDEWDKEPNKNISHYLHYVDNVEQSPSDMGEGVLMSATCSQSDSTESTDMQPYLSVHVCNHRLAAPTELSSKQLKKQLTQLENVPKNGTPLVVTKARYKNGSLQVLFTCKWTEGTTLRNYSCWIDTSHHPNLNEQLFVNKFCKPNGKCKTPGGNIVTIQGSKRKYAKNLCY